MIKYNKNNGLLVEKFLTKEEARLLEARRNTTIQLVYKELANKSQGLKDRYDELCGNDYLITIPRDAI